MKVFLLVFLSLIISLGYFIGIELIQPLSQNISPSFLWGIHSFLFFIMAISPILYRVNKLSVLLKYYKTLQRIAYLLMGFYFLVLIFVLIKIFLVPLGVSDYYLTIFIVVISLLLTMIGLYKAKKNPTVLEVKIPIPGLSEEFYQLKMIQLSDVHVGQNIGKEYLKKIVTVVEEIKPDLIFLTGDLIDGFVDDLRDDLSEFKKLNAKFGIFYVPGNHEYYWNFEEWMKFFSHELKFKVLLNDSCDVLLGKYKLKIAGVHDLHAHRINRNYKILPDQALKGDDVLIKILLAHQPNSIFKLKEERADLILSGHTHAGQFFPANIFIYIFQKFVKGVYRFKNSWVYVNQGTGFWGPPNRLGTTSEITLLRFSKEE